MAKTAKSLIIASVEAYSGKSATILGAARQLQKKGVSLSYTKPVGNYFHQEETGIVEDDVQFIAKTLELSSEQIGSPLVSLSQATIAQRTKMGTGDYSQALQKQVAGFKDDLVLVEAPPTLAEGSLFHLSTPQMAQTLAAPVLIVVRYHPLSMLDQILAAQQQLGESLMGVVINDVPATAAEEISDQIHPFLASQGLSVFGVLPESNLLHSVSVREMAEHLSAKVLCRSDRLDLMVERLTIGAMNVSSALKYFHKGQNLAVITGGDRSDLQLAALETSAHCLILTGQVAPQEFILSRADTLEIPMLAVEYDTLTTVQIAERTFQQVRIQAPIKVRLIQELMVQHFDLDRLMAKLGLNN